MVRVRVRRVRMTVVVTMRMVVMVMRVIVVMPMMMTMVMMIMTEIFYNGQRCGLGVAVDWCPGQAVLFAEFLIAAGGVTVAFAWAIFQPAADTLYMMMMALLGTADICLKAKYLFAVLAHLAIHVVRAFEDLVDPLGHGVDHQRMVIEIVSLDIFNARMARRNFIRLRIDPLH